MIDKNVLKGLKNGKINHFETVYHLYNGWVYNFVYALVKDAATAQDITQDVFLQIWSSRRQIDCNKNFEGYLFRIARNATYHYTQRELLRQGYIKRMSMEKSSDYVNIESEIEHSLMEDYVMSMSQDLPAIRRKILMLYWKSGMTYKEIAGILDISEKTVATQIHRSVKFLKSGIDG